MTPNKLMIIGLTGLSGSGKGEVSRLLAARGGAVLDADAVSREVTLPGGAAYAEAVEVFGEEILDGGGFIDRAALAEIVFADWPKKRLLEQIVHKSVIEMMESETAALVGRVPPPPFVVWDAPLLIEAGMDKRCGRVWVVTAPYEVRLARIMARDGLDERRARLRLDSQTPERELTARADAVIVNDGDLSGVEEKVERLLESILM